MENLNRSLGLANAALIYEAEGSEYVGSSIGWEFLGDTRKGIYSEDPIARCLPEFKDALRTRYQKAVHPVLHLAALGIPDKKTS